MGKIIGVSNQKGGVGKTTTVINLGACLAEAGKKVLIIDIDPQGNATTGLGLDKNRLDRTTYSLLISDVDAKDCVVRTEYENLDIIPTNVDLSGAEIELIDVEKPQYILKKKIAKVKDDYDYIVIDCPPSLSMLTVNAMTAADAIIVPIQCEFLALEGLKQILDNINRVKKRMNPYLEFDGIVFTMYDGRTNLSPMVVEDVKANVPANRIYSTIIPRNVRLSEAPSFGQPITAYDSRCAGAEAYRNLASEVIARN